MEIQPALDFFDAMFALSITVIVAIIVVYILKIIMVIVETSKAYRQKSAKRRSSKVPRR